MVYSDNFAEGIGLLLIFIAGLTFVLAVMAMPILYWILKRTHDLNTRRIIQAIALVPGLLLVMSSFLESGGLAMVFISLLFIGPVAVLIPPFGFPGIIGPGTRFRRILFVYFTIIVFEIFLLFGSLQLRLYLGRADFWDLPGSAAVLYSGLAILDILFAGAVYRILPLSRPAVREKSEKPA